MRDIVGFKAVQERELEALYKILDGNWITDWSVAVDGGAHVGGWSAVMANWFRTVFAFEPAQDTFLKLRSNMHVFPNVRPHQLALMDKRQTVEITWTTQSTARQVNPKDGADILAVPLDEFDLPSCGLIKLDLEGCEIFALKGATKTIKRHKPFLIVEMAGHWKRFEVKERDILDWIKTRGYREVFRSGVNVGFAAR